MEKRLQLTREWSPALVTLSDEASYRYVDRSPPAMAHFQSCLAARYGTIDALNAAWGSEYAGWREAERVDPLEALARFGGNPAAGYASSLYSRQVTGDLYAFQKGLIHSFVPGLRCGPEGVWANPEYFSIDYLRLLREHGWVASAAGRGRIRRWASRSLDPSRSG